MIELKIPGYKLLRIQHLVLDYNGTIALDGNLCNGIAERITSLSEDLDVHVLTADTFGKARNNLNGLQCNVTVLPKNNQEQAKAEYIENLGAQSVIAIGNGRNDHLMLQKAHLGIAILMEEGIAIETFQNASIIVKDINHALDLLLNPLRLIATLRS